LISGLKKKKIKKMKKAFLMALMTKAAILVKAVLLGAVILAKKALIVSILSLFLSAMTASKKTTTPNGNKGDHKYTYRRFGTDNYFDLNPDNGDKYIDPLSHTKQRLTSQEYHNQYYQNFVHNYEDIYNGDNVENGSFENQARVPARHANRHKTYDANSDWLGLTYPDHVQ
jgi:hypothetical protein